MNPPHVGWTFRRSPPRGVWERLHVPYSWERLGTLGGTGRNDWERVRERATSKNRERPRERGGTPTTVGLGVVFLIALNDRIELRWWTLLSRGCQRTTTVEAIPSAGSRLRLAWDTVIVTAVTNAQRLCGSPSACGAEGGGP